MTKKIRTLTMVDRWAGMAPLRRSALIIGALGTIATGVVAVANASKVAEPYWIATRGFVAQEIKTASEQNGKTLGELAKRQISTQLSMARNNQADTEAKLADKHLLLDQNPGMPQNIKSSIEEQIRELQRRLEVSKYEIDGLRNDLGRSQ